MSHRHYWAKIDYQRADQLAGSGGLRAGSRNAEKLGVVVSIGSRSSIVGGPGKRNLGEYAK